MEVFFSVEHAAAKTRVSTSVILRALFKFFLFSSNMNNCKNATLFYGKCFFSATNLVILNKSHFSGYNVKAGGWEGIPGERKSDRDVRIRTVRLGLNVTGVAGRVDNE